MSDLEDSLNLKARYDDLRQQHTRLQRSHMRLKEKNAELVDATIQAAHDAMTDLGPLQPVPAPAPDRRKASAESALPHFTDWQGAKVTTSYDSEVMKKRVMAAAQKVVRLTEIQRADHPVNDCHLMLGGDMIEGLFNFPTQPFEIDQTLFGQYVTVSRLITDVVRLMLANFQRVTVYGEWGNHGRLGSRRDAVPRADNADRMTYELARQVLMSTSQDRLTWVDSAEDIQRVEIGNYRALLMHGDEIGRNGFASPMTIVRSANQWASGAYPWEFRDVYVGHYHTHNEWAMANGLGSVYQTGSTESDNRYARETMAASAQPSQRLHFVSPSKGRVTTQYKIHLGEDA